jgi:hypothetical protein
MPGQSFMISPARDDRLLLRVVKMSDIIFIDANQYLKVYGIVAGKTTLDLLDQKKDHIFVSKQIVEEFTRNKLGCASVFFSDKFKEIDKLDISLPDHLLGVNDETTKKFRKTFEQAKAAKAEIIGVAQQALSQISRSEDEVSKRLSGLFDKAISPSEDEMRRARDRKERGNPPGKTSDTLGDQITWEQLLTYCKEIDCKRLWIITSDEDFFTKSLKRCLLNSLLTNEITGACGAELDVRCFDNLLTGIQDFDAITGATAEDPLTPEESADIQKQFDDLSWLTGTDDATMTVIRNQQYGQRRFLATVNSGVTYAMTPLPQLLSKE